MLNIFFSLTSGSFFLLAFIIAINLKKVNIIANKWLAMFLFLVGIVLLGEPIFEAKFFHRFPYLIGIMNFPMFAIAPTLYFSIEYFVSPAKKFSKKDLWYFLPYFILSLLTVAYLLIPASFRLKEIEKPVSSPDIIEAIVLIILPLSVYWFLAYKKLLKHQKSIQTFASTTETVDLAWLRYYLIGLGVMIFAWSIDITFTLGIINQISNLIYFCSVYYLAYFALSQVEIFSEKKQELLEIKALIEEKNTEKKQLLNDEQLLNLKSKLITLMTIEKPFLDSELNLSKLAQKMNISTHELSFLINEGFNDNFFGFINRYRVEESQSLLSNPKFQHLSMVGIAFEAGFNSKTAFNTAFKKFLGVSPSEFQKQKN